MSDVAVPSDLPVVVEPRTPEEASRGTRSPMTPREIVSELDRYIVGQRAAKRSVAIALRNRWRRQQVTGELRDEITPKNIILIGPTGVGKTEISRRLARLAQAPFLKVEASKFTEVGYVGRDVESIVRDLTELAIEMVRQERESEVEDLANEKVDERLLDLLPPPTRRKPGRLQRAPLRGGEIDVVGAGEAGGVFVVSATGDVKQERGADAAQDRYKRTREKLKQLLLDGQLDGREVEIEVTPNQGPMFDVVASQGAPEGMENFTEMLRDMMPKKTKKRTVKVSEARRILIDEEFQKLVDMEDVTADAQACRSASSSSTRSTRSPARRARWAAPTSPRGVQRDLLPIVEDPTCRPSTAW
jgi:ATP-dependent HslUV protease ATP-binding subunit HslU